MNPIKRSASDLGISRDFQYAKKKDIDNKSFSRNHEETQTQAVDARSRGTQFDNRDTWLKPTLLNGRRTSPGARPSPVARPVAVSIHLANVPSRYRPSYGQDMVDSATQTEKVMVDAGSQFDGNSRSTPSSFLPAIIPAGNGELLQAPRRPSPRTPAEYSASNINQAGLPNVSASPQGGRKSPAMSPLSSAGVATTPAGSIPHFPNLRSTTLHLPVVLNPSFTSGQVSPPTSPSTFWQSLAAFGDHAVQSSTSLPVRVATSSSEVNSPFAAGMAGGSASSMTATSPITALWNSMATSYLPLGNDAVPKSPSQNDLWPSLDMYSQSPVAHQTFDDLSSVFHKNYSDLTGNSPVAAQSPTSNQRRTTASMEMPQIRMVGAGGETKIRDTEGLRRFLRTIPYADLEGLKPNIYDTEVKELLKANNGVIDPEGLLGGGQMVRTVANYLIEYHPDNLPRPFDRSIGVANPSEGHSNEPFRVVSYLNKMGACALIEKKGLGSFRSKDDVRAHANKEKSLISLAIIEQAFAGI